MARGKGKGTTQEVGNPKTGWSALPRKRGDRPTVADVFAPSNQLVESAGGEAGLVDGPAQPTHRQVEDIVDAMRAKGSENGGDGGAHGAEGPNQRSFHLEPKLRKKMGERGGSGMVANEKSQCRAERAVPERVGHLS